MLKSMDEAMSVAMLDLIKDLMKRNQARQFFNSPVDWRTLKLLNYPLVIKDPMDLGTIRKHLEADMGKSFADKRYQFAEEFAHDVRLVWKNSFIFWSHVPTQAVFKGAKALSDIFEQKLVAAYRPAELQGPPCSLKVRTPLRSSSRLRDRRR